MLLNAVCFGEKIDNNSNSSIQIKENVTSLNDQSIIKIKEKYKVGDIIKRGKLNYTLIDQNNYEDVEWIVLDIQGSNILLLSRKIINFMPYSEVVEENINWNNSSIREYLNNDFLDGLHVMYNDYKYINYLKKTTISTNISTYDNNLNTNIVTNDKVFLLSKDEIMKYFECIDNKYQCEPGIAIDYVKHVKLESIYEDIIEANRYNFLLRDLNSSNDSIVYVDSNGEIIETGISADTPCGIRPAMWINDSSIISDNTILYGKYEQDNDFSNGKETIEWIPLATNNQKVLLISKYILDFQIYSISKNNANWETSSIRKFLNDGFINESFTTNERHHIALSDVISYTGSYRDKEGAINTSDYIFIPGYEDYDLYTTYDNFISKVYKTNCTKYSSTLIESNEYKSFYWLRDFYTKYHQAVYVRHNGEIEWDLEKLKIEKLGIRPMMWLDLSKDDISNIINNISNKKNDGPISDILMQKPIIVDQAKQEFILGKYEQDGETSNGKEDVEWIILGTASEINNNEYICISKYIIDEYKFDDNIGVEYQNSEIRKVLIGNIYNNMFNEYEKTLLCDIDIGNNIFDKISLLNFDMCMKYSDVEYYPQYGNIEYLKPASVTPYAKNNYTKYTGEKLSVNKSGNGAYYLRDIDDACYGVYL